MTLLLKIERGYSADAIVIGNVVSYIYLGDSDYMITYEDPQRDYEMFDITIKHVTEIKEVRL